MARPRSPARGAEHALYDVIRHVRPLHRYLARAVEDRLAGTGVTVPMRALLERLLEAGPETVPQAGRALLLPRQFVQRTADAAEAEALLASRPNPAHRRSPLLELTPRGRLAIERIKAREEAVLREVARELTRKDIDAALRVVGHLTARLRTLTGGLAEEPPDAPPPTRGRS